MMIVMPDGSLKQELTAESRIERQREQILDDIRFAWVIFQPKNKKAKKMLNRANRIKKISVNDLPGYIRRNCPEIWKNVK